MEAGKWIIFAALAGAVFVGFKSRQLKSYEFVVCGLFVLLLDGLVFKGQITKWVGDLGSNLPDVAKTVSPGMALGLTPNARCWLARFGRAVRANLPHWSDYVITAALTVVAHYVLGLSWWFGAVLYGVLAVLLAAKALLAMPAADPGEDAAAGSGGER
ncbi:hypothetical protein ACIBG8_46840 [Nonomuraea sp. NPDC050556]|uniref:hypothetical protein n=1 Tax=Nonomuraea sp. NPDC050556 TaxID=3364369 RepID=UPI00379BAF24